MKWTFDLREVLPVIGRGLHQFGADVWDVLRDAIQHFTDSRAGQAAAGLAYYAFFSLFPLLLVLVSVTSPMLAGESATDRAIELVRQALPVSPELVERNIQRVLTLRGPVGLASLVGLLWSATAVFNILADNINRAWKDAKMRGYLERRLVALVMVAAIFGLLLLSLSSTTLVRLLPELEVPLNGGTLYDTVLWRVGVRQLPWLFTFLMFLALYRWVPNTEVRWQAALLGALIAAVAWESAKTGIAWYLSSGLVRYELVYGSLSTVVALLFWVYISALIVLFGAHLSAALDRWLAPEVIEEERGRRVFVVLNPVAGTSNVERLRRLITRRMAEVAWQPEIYETTGDEVVADVVRAARERDFDLFIAVGGDGTVAGVAEALVGTDIPVGIIPSGTGNALARELSIPQVAESALDMILASAASRCIDAIQIEDRHYFMNASIGMSAQAMRDTERSMKRRMGLLAYLVSGLKKLVGLQPARFSLILDGERQHVHATDIVIANGGELGLGAGMPDIRLAPDTRIDDGELNVIIVRARNSLDYLRIAWGMLFGQNRHNPHVRFLKARHIFVESERELPVQADGEFIGLQSLEVQIVPHAVRFIVSHNGDV